MKKTIVLLLMICIIASCEVKFVLAEEGEDKVQLSSLNNDECKEFLFDHGVEIPYELRDIDLPRLVFDLENNPDMTVSLGWTTLSNFIEKVRFVVNSYYDIKRAIPTRGLTYTLQYSTVYSWDAATMPFYNCYAYAIGLPTRCDPGDFSDQTYDEYATIDELADMIKDDLNGSLGYDCVKVQSSYPFSITGWSNVIAVRKDTTFDWYGHNDYHFARLISNDWYHKPGNTAILKFNNAPSNYIEWTNEAYNGSFFEPTITYDSDLRFLLYKPNHDNTTQTWTGEHYHSGTRHYYLYEYECYDCGDVYTAWISVPCGGPPCLTPWGHNPEPELS